MSEMQNANVGTKLIEDISKALEVAVRANNLSDVKDILDNQFSSISSKINPSALKLAAEMNNYTIYKTIQSHWNCVGELSEKDKMDVLDLAVKSGSLTIIEDFINNSGLFFYDKTLADILKLAINENKSTIAESIIAKLVTTHANISMGEVLKTAVEENNDKIVKGLLNKMPENITNDDRYLAIQTAVEQNKSEILEILLKDQSLKVNEDLYNYYISPALEVVAENNYQAIIKILLKDSNLSTFIPKEEKTLALKIAAEKHNSALFNDMYVKLSGDISSEDRIEILNLAEENGCLKIIGEQQAEHSL